MRSDLVPLSGEKDLVGQEIEVIVRYKGQEFTAGSGFVREVSIQNEFRSLPMMIGDTHAGSIELTGERTISITLQETR